MPSILVSVPNTQPYPVIVEPGLLTRIGQTLRNLTPSKRIAIVTDTSVGELYLPIVEQALRDAKYETIVAVIPAGEEHKTTSAVAEIYDALLSAKIDRATPVLAMGGGVVGDTAGFAAATMLRGVPLVQMPTTLLAMVDASVGGKTGVNHALGKNLIGAFHQPIAVLIDPKTLTTLPPRELRSGLAECIKHDIIRDADGFANLESNISRAAALDIDYLTQLVAHNVAIKARVVEADPFERGERAHLNFGHTFGHAIEKVSKYTLAHGECVALGMVAAIFVAEQLRMLDAASRKRIVDLISAAALPTSGLRYPTEAIVDAMAFDKKVSAGKLRFVLPDRIGHVVIRDDISIGLIRDAIESLRR